MALELYHLMIATPIVVFILANLGWFYDEIFRLDYEDEEVSVSDETLNNDEPSAFSASMFLAMDE